MAITFKVNTSVFFDATDTNAPFVFDFNSQRDWGNAAEFLSPQLNLEAATTEALLADDSDMRPLDPNDPVNIGLIVATDVPMVADDSDMRPLDPNDPANVVDYILAPNEPMVADDSDMRPLDPNDPVNQAFELATSDVMPADVEFPILIAIPDHAPISLHVGWLF